MVANGACIGSGAEDLRPATHPGVTRHGLVLWGVGSGAVCAGSRPPYWGWAACSCADA